MYILSPTHLVIYSDENVFFSRFFHIYDRTYVAVGTYLKQLIMMFPLMIDSSHWKRVQLVECNLQNNIK